MKTSFWKLGIKDFPNKKRGTPTLPKVPKNSYASKSIYVSIPLEYS
jgi:hypothetical protein